MKLSLLHFAILISNFLFSQTLTPKQERAIRGTMVYYFGESINREPLKVGMASFLYVGKDTFYSPNGFHYVFQLKGDTAIRLDKTYFHGGNFRRYLYARGKYIYQLGGYGLYNTNNNLEVFDLSINKWRLEKTTGEKPTYINGVVLEKGGILYSFYNYKSGNNIEADVYDNNIYRFNPALNNWVQFSNINPEIQEPIKSFYTSNFVVSISGNEALVFEKKSLKYITLGRDALYFSHYEYYYEVDGDQIKFGQTNKPIDLNALWKENEHLSKPFILEPKWYQLPTAKISATVFFGLIMFASLFLILKSQRRRKQNLIFSQTETQTGHPLLAKILSAPKQALDINELDTLLEIDHMEFDSRKLKRHRLLSDLEKMHPGLIERQKDETDKRRFIYVIKNTH
jgi:hypothetical protein